MKRFGIPLAVAAAWCALILFVHRDSPRTLVSAHGLLHAAIAGQYAPGVERPPFATPPENPLFAGTPLPYYYFFHAVGAQVAALLGTDVIHAFELLVIAAAFAAVLFGFVLGARLHGGGAAGRAFGAAFALLLFAGCHPQGPLVLLARWIRDGSAAFADRGQYLWGLVHPINGAMRLGDYWGALGPLASYFFNVTARPLALASLVLVIASLAWVPAEGRRGCARALLGVVLATAFCALWSPLIALAAASALALSFALDAELRRRRAPAGSGSRLVLRQWLCAASLLAGAALAWPWYRHLLGDGAGTVAFGLQPKRALGIVASAWLVALLAWRGAAPIRGDAGALPHVLSLAGLLLASAAMFVALPVGNEDNFLHAALVFWSGAAAGFVVARPGPEGGGRGGARRRLVALHLAFLPTLAIVVLAYTNRPPIPIALERGELQRTPADGPEARLYRWLRSSTPADAVVVQDPGREGRQCTGNTSELPAFTGRSLFTDYWGHYLVAPHPEAGLRVELSQRLARGEPLARAEERYLSALGRPLFLVSRGADAATVERLASAFGAPRFEADPIRVFAWRAHE